MSQPVANIQNRNRGVLNNALRSRRQSAERKAQPVESNKPVGFDHLIPDLSLYVAEYLPERALCCLASVSNSMLRLSKRAICNENRLKFFKPLTSVLDEVGHWVFIRENNHRIEAVLKSFNPSALIYNEDRDQWGVNINRWNESDFKGLAKNIKKLYWYQADRIAKAVIIKMFELHKINRSQNSLEVDTFVTDDLPEIGRWLAEQGLVKGAFFVAKILLAYGYLFGVEDIGIALCGYADYKQYASQIYNDLVSLCVRRQARYPRQLDCLLISS